MDDTFILCPHYGNKDGQCLHMQLRGKAYLHIIIHSDDESNSIRGEVIDPHTTHCTDDERLAPIHTHACREE